MVYTPAVPQENRILSFFRDNGYALHKRAEVLGFLSHSKKHFALPERMERRRLRRCWLFC